MMKNMIIAAALMVLPAQAMAWTAIPHQMSGDPVCYVTNEDGNFFWGMFEQEGEKVQVMSPYNASIPVFSVEIDGNKKIFQSREEAIVVGDFIPWSLIDGAVISIRFMSDGGLVEVDELLYGFKDEYRACLEHMNW